MMVVTQLTTEMFPVYVQGVLHLHLHLHFDLDLDLDLDFDLDLDLDLHLHLHLQANELTAAMFSVYKATGAHWSKRRRLVCCSDLIMMVMWMMVMWMMVMVMIK